jgi:ParB family transcriptional regulator, chromosome partitioning protein
MGAPSTGPPQVIPVNLIDPAEDNFRGPVGDVTELANLIRAQGLLQAITVTPRPDGRYKVVFGHRRLAAVQSLGWAEIEARVREYTDAERLAVMLAENLGREDLSPLQEARAYQAMLELTDEQGRKVYTQRTLAQKLGVGQAKVSNYTSIFKLPDDVVAALDSGDINVTQAIQLARLAKHPDRVQAALSSYRRLGGDMELAVRRQQDDLEREQARSKKLKELKSTGVRIAPDDWMGAGGRRIGPGFPLPIEPEEHAGEPCHAATVSATGEVIYLCMEPERHRPAPATSPEPTAAGEGQVPTSGRPGLSVVPAPPEKTPEEDAAEAARRAEEEARQAAAQARLEALQTAAEGRAAALGTLLAGRQGKGEVTRRFLNWFLLRLLDESYEDSFVMQALSIEPLADAEADEAWQLLEYAAKNNDSLQRAAVAVACDMVEEQLQGEYPNFANPHVQLYYEYLAQTGVYELSDVERAELQAAGVELPEPPKEEDVTA